MQVSSSTYKIHYQDEYISISMMEEKPVIIFKAVGLPKNSDHFKEEFTYVLDYIHAQSQKHPIIAILGDLREVQTLIDEDMQYLCEVFYPSVDQTHVKKIALVMPVSIFSQIALELLYSKVRVENITIKIFKDADSGMQWLQEDL